MYEMHSKSPNKKSKNQKKPHDVIYSLSIIPNNNDHTAKQIFNSKVHKNRKKFSLAQQNAILENIKKGLNIWKNLWKFNCILDLTNQNIGYYGVLHLSIFDQVQYLTALKLHGNMIEDAGVRLLSLRDWSIIQQIYLSGNLIGPEGVKHLLKSQWENLTIIDLSDNPLGQLGLKYLTKLKSSLRLHKLQLQNCGVKGGQLSNVINLLGMKQLKILNFRNNKLNYWSFISFAKCLKMLEKLEVINIENNSAYDENIAKKTLPNKINYLISQSK